jgi:hypothetical protein
MRGFRSTYHHPLRAEIKNGRPCGWNCNNRVTELTSNPKSETRNPKQIQNPNEKGQKPNGSGSFEHFTFRNLNLFRISDFPRRAG